ncbi:MAG TPA: LLM class flavin-dependent oxidoreductase, partial [Stellaceae bacterium]|nr:LLM class flavin-dependent oxidoreductase [Stellaceae bacterium]
ARALEERGFESVWAPEHSHIPLSRKTPFPGGGDLPKQYYDAMDPFVVLAAASQVTKTITTRHRRAARPAARRDPDRQTDRLNRPGEQGMFPVWRRRRLEPG